MPNKLFVAADSRYYTALSSNRSVAQGIGDKSPAYSINLATGEVQNRCTVANFSHTLSFEQGAYDLPHRRGLVVNTANGQIIFALRTASNRFFVYRANSSFVVQSSIEQLASTANGIRSVGVYNATGAVYMVSNSNTTWDGGSYRLRAFDSSNVFLWGVGDFSTAPNDIGTPYTMAVNQSNGSVVIVGNQGGFASWRTFISFDSSGGFLFSGYLQEGVWANAFDVDIEQSTGNFYIAHTVVDSSSISKYSNTGVLIWRRLLRNMADTSNLEGRIVRVDQTTGDVYLGSAHTATGTAAGTVVAKYNSSGDELWKVSPQRHGYPQSIFDLETNASADILYASGTTLLPINKSDGSIAAAPSYFNVVGSAYRHFSILQWNAFNSEMVIGGKRGSLGKAIQCNVATGLQESTINTQQSFVPAITHMDVDPSNSQIIAIGSKDPSMGVLDSLFVERYTHAGDLLWRQDTAATQVTSQLYYSTFIDPVDSSTYVGIAGIGSGRVIRIPLNGLSVDAIVNTSSSIPRLVGFGNDGNIYGFTTGTAKQVTVRTKTGSLIGATPTSGISWPTTLSTALAWHCVTGSKMIYVNSYWVAYLDLTDPTGFTDNEILWGYGQAELGLHSATDIYASAYDPVLDRLYIAVRLSGQTFNTMCIKYITVSTGVISEWSSIVMAGRPSRLLYDPDNNALHFWSHPGNSDVAGYSIDTDTELYRLSSATAIDHAINEVHRGAMTLWRESYPINNVIFSLLPPFNLQSIATGGDRALVGWDWSAT